ncbi:GNAT family N-acetyltransferase [Actinoplanes subglobosus]|uniref:GNAT family N-acetyltransferase n=1 Tax=Actinoplanes subglobosus TaxID=1547892 RepID=A0ABV8IWE5_9ACTN
MLRLVKPTIRLHTAWLDSRDDWGRGTHQPGAGLRSIDEVDSPAGFAAWVGRLHAHEDRSVPPEDGWVHCTYRWVINDDEVVGAIALRHELNDSLLDVGGHIGYGVRPVARRRGLASWALGTMLDEARRLGMDRVLLTCKTDNVASARTIEGHGGLLEDVRDTGSGKSKRYWIPL